MAAISLPATRATAADEPATWRLEIAEAANQVRRVKAILEVTGTLKANPDGKELRSLPLKVKGELEYDARLLRGSADPPVRHEARYYRGAEAAISVDGHEHGTTLRSHQRLVAAQATGTDCQLSTPLGPLTREELELLEIPGDPLLLPRLLPARPVAVSDSWSPADEVWAALLRLDLVHQNTCQLTLREVKDQVAVIDLAGAVAGAVGGVASDVELKGVCNFDLRQRDFTWLALSLQEKRAVGHAEPGFAVQARLRLASQPQALPSELADAALKGLELQPSAGSQLLSLETHGGFQLIHERGWRVMVDRHDVTILRLVEKGDLIAQCNASTLASSEPGQQLTLEAFETDVKRALGSSFGRIEEASQSMSESGLRILRAVVSGIVSEVPIYWTYYHLSDKEGRQAAVVFTLDAKLVEQFAGKDQLLVDSFQFTRQIPVAR